MFTSETGCPPPELFVTVIIANGTRANVLDDIMAGHEVGTLFLARGESLPAWKRWIGFTVAPRGRYVLDDGARRAMIDIFDLLGPGSDLADHYRSELGKVLFR